MSKNDGGPAFPISNPDHQTFNPGTVSDLQRLMSGMSLRDYFAAKAMAAMIVARYDEHMREFDGWREEFAREAGRYADAMLAERGMSDVDIRDSDIDEHGRASKPDPADELVELMSEHFPRADADRMHAYLNRLHDETFSLRRKLAAATRRAA